MSDYAFCFPGQGSQRVDMFASYANLPQVAQALAQASSALDEDLAASCKEQSALDDTANTQPILLTIGVGVYRAWLAAGGAVPRLLAGHSLGEFAAMVAGGCIDFADAVRLVRQRALAMQAAVPAGTGIMSAVLGLARAQVDTICAELGAQAWPANYNAPGQVVLAGLRTDVERAAAACKKAGAKRVLTLPVSVPSHCPLMQPAAAALDTALAAVRITDATIPIVQNATAQPASAAVTLTANLVKQLVQPVDWIGCANALGAVGKVVECGPTKVLFALNRRILAADKCVTLDSDMALQELLT